MNIEFEKADKVNIIRIKDFYDVSELIFITEYIDKKYHPIEDMFFIVDCVNFKSFSNTGGELFLLQSHVKKK